MKEMPEVLRYRKLPVEISAIELRAYGDFTRARDWINDNGGSAAFGPGVDGDVLLLISTLEGTMEAATGWFIIQGVRGEFYPCEGDIFRLTYEAVEAPEAEALTGTGSYVRGAPDGSRSLCGWRCKAGANHVNRTAAEIAVELRKNIASPYPLPNSTYREAADCLEALDTDNAQMLAALRSAWVGLVPSMSHSFRECNGGPDSGGPWCFTCDAMGAIQPFQHLWAGKE